MKILLKKVIIYTAIVFTILVLIFTICKEFQIKNETNIFWENHTDEEKLNNEITTLTTNELMQVQRINTLSEIMDINLIFFYISLILGGLISSISLYKENAKAKVLLLFIVGNVLINFIVTIIKIIIYNSYNNKLYFISEYINIFLKLIIPYILVFIIFFLIKLLIRKLKNNQ